MPFLLKMHCDCCGDLSTAVYPCKFVYHDGLTVELNICLDCMNDGILEIDLGRKRMVAGILKRIKEKG